MWSFSHETRVLTSRLDESARLIVPVISPLSTYLLLI